MDWIEVTARTFEEAKDQLLDRLGVAEDEAEFEVTEEPKPGLFGRSRGLYRVRARVAPKQVRKPDTRQKRQQRQPRDNAGKAQRSANTAPPAPAPKAPAPAREALDTETAATEARKFLSEMAQRFGVDAEVQVSVDEEGHLAGSIEGDQLGRLIGPRGGMIVALEELTRTRLQHVADGRSTPRFRLDVGGYRSERFVTLGQVIDRAINEVRSTGVRQIFDISHSGERKFVHDYVKEHGDSAVLTMSQGEEPNRRIVLYSAD